MVNVKQVKKLREKTGVGVLQCKKALEECKGDEARALEILHERGKAVALKKSEREARQGIIESYIHSNAKIGVMLELNCETDFVARNSEFKELAHDIAMHIAGMDSKDEKSLLEEQFVKNLDITVKDLVDEKIAKLGENIKVGRFIRYEL